MATPSMLDLFERYGDVIFRRCLRLLRDEAEAHDAVQDVFLKALTRGSSYDGRGAPLTWLYGIATLHCLQALRNRGRRAALDGELPARGPQNPDAENRLLVRILLEDLEPELQQMVVLRFVDGMTVEEVAEVVGISRKTAGKRLAAFAERSRRLLEGELEESHG
jgi:RNA polymerase sigma-70 factor (ECF subfamily)